MTCIASWIESPNKIHIAADSLASADYTKSFRKDRKVFKINDEIIIGFAGSFRMGQLLQYSQIEGGLYTLQVPDEPDYVYEFMVNDFINRTRLIFEDGGFLKKINEVEEGGEFIVGLRGRVFTIYDDFQVEENDCPYSAIGCGAETAMGALMALDPYEVPDRLKKAIQITSQISRAVGGRIHQETLESLEN